MLHPRTCSAPQLFTQPSPGFSWPPNLERSCSSSAALRPVRLSPSRSPSRTRNSLSPQRGGRNIHCQDEETANAVGANTLLRAAVDGHLDVVAWLRDEVQATGLGHSLASPSMSLKVSSRVGDPASARRKSQGPASARMKSQDRSSSPARRSRMRTSLTVGSFAACGEKPSWPTRWICQDTHLVLPLPDNQLLVAVFDGHGEHGHHVSGQVRRIFEQQVHAIISESAGVEDALPRIFVMCQAALERSEDMCCLSGTTATVALVDAGRERVTAAHVGDSTLIVARDGELVFATRDHKPDLENEERRILACGGVVRGAAPGQEQRLGYAKRVFAKDQGYPGLAISRALGDLVANRLGVLSDPEISCGPFKRGDTLVVASDGLWDVMSRDRVAAQVASSAVDDPDSAARSFVMTARGRWPAGGDIDDITVVVVHAVEGGGFLQSL